MMETSQCLRLVYSLHLGRHFQSKSYSYDYHCSGFEGGLGNGINTVWSYKKDGREHTKAAP